MLDLSARTANALETSSWPYEKDGRRLIVEESSQPPWLFEQFLLDSPRVLCHVLATPFEFNSWRVLLCPPCATCPDRNGSAGHRRARAPG